MFQRNTPVVKIDYAKLASYLTEKEIKKLEQIFKKLDIHFERSFEHINSSLKQPDIHLDKSELPKYSLRKTDHLRTYLVNNPHIPFQLRIEPDNTSLDSIQNDEIRMAFNWATQFLKSKGYRQYVYFRDSESMQFLPVADSGRIVDFNEKVSRLYYLFWQDQDALQSLTPIQACQPNNMLLHFQRETTWVNINLLNARTERMLFRNLEETACISTVESTHFNYISKSQNEVNGCAFCRENVIRNQLLMDCGSLLVLTNYAPTTESELRFLIISTKHIEDWSELDAVAQSYLPYIITALSRSIQCNDKRQHDEIISYVQNGVQTGQTVPHSHMHLLTKPVRPAFFTSVLSEGLGIPSEILSKEKMQAIQNKFVPLLYQELSMQAPVPKQISLR